MPWEQLKLPHEVDGSAGTFRAPRATSTLDADNDYAAVHAWLSLHESAATRRAYRKEAERLILWAIVERGRALSSLTTEDAVAYRAFVRRPTPHERWVRLCGRAAPDWRPFPGALSARSAAYTLSVLGALFRWLIEQRYLLANPFAGVKVRDTRGPNALDTSHAFTEGGGCSCARSPTRPSSARARRPRRSRAGRRPPRNGCASFSISAMRPGCARAKLVGATLGDIETDAHGDAWLKVIGKGSKAARVALPLARTRPTVSWSHAGCRSRRRAGGPTRR